MNRRLSLYLDSWRFLAALMVFFSHIPEVTKGFLWQLGGLGHEAVMLFFVLSGFVIAYVVIDKQESAQQYLINRLARIYSVALPAVLLTMLLYYASLAIDPQSVSKVTDRMQDPTWTFFAALTFINQNW